MIKSLKQLFPYVGKYRIYAILTPIIVALEVVMECLIPFFAADLITYVQQNYSTEGNIITKWFINFIQAIIPDAPLAVVGGYCILLILQNVLIYIIL